MTIGQVVFSTSEAPEITIVSVSGDLRLTGWELNQFRAEASRQDELMVEQVPEGVRLTCRSDASVSVPRQARVIIQEVKGDVKAKALAGSLELQTVGGCLTLRHTGAVSAVRVNGDVEARRVGGALKLGKVTGCVSVRSVSGEVEVDAHSDLDINQASQSIRARAGGDIDLRHCLAPGATYVLEASGDIRLRAEPGVWARFEMQAGGEVIARARGAQTEGSGKYQVVTVGQGEAGSTAQAQVMARAGGDVILGGPTPSAELDDLGDDLGSLADEYAAQIETQVHSHMAELERQLADRLAQVNMSAGANVVDSAAMAARVREAAEKVGDKARRRAEAAQRKVERQAARSRHDWNWNFEMPPRGPNVGPAAPPVEPVSEAERLAILRMLGDGKISVDEAEKLLAALEGRL